MEQGFNDAQNAFLYNLTSFAELVPELEFLVAGSVKKGFAGAKYIDNYINKVKERQEKRGNREWMKRRAIDMFRFIRW